MAYDSDTHVKNILREIHLKADLKNLKPRFFAESSEDHKLWEDGGLTFKQYDIEYGSNDFGWFIKKDSIINGKNCTDSPKVIVEATLGLRHRNTGSAQLARFSHALGACHNGACGILFQDFVWDGDQPARTQPDLMYAALNAGKRLECPYIVVDIKDHDLMIRVLQAYDLDDENLLKAAIKEAQIKMKSHIDKYAEKMTKKPLALEKDQLKEIKFTELIKKHDSYNGIVTIKWFDYENFTVSKKRNGHTILGEGLVYAHIIHPKKHYILLPRMLKEDIESLRSTSGKEQTLLFNHPNMELLGFDDLVCKDNSIREIISEMRGKSFKGEKEIMEKKLSEKKYFSTQRKNAFAKTFKENLIKGSIKINI